MDAAETFTWEVKNVPIGFEYLKNDPAAQRAVWSVVEQFLRGYSERSTSRPSSVPNNGVGLV